MDITVNDFQTEVLESNIPVLADFWASWCGPCKMIAPIISQLEEEYKGKIKIVSINIDEETDLAKKYGIMSIPTFLLFNSGNISEKLIGLRNKDELKTIIDKYI